MNMNMDASFSSLELNWRTRPGGSGKTHREYLDFVIDGQSLYDLLDPGDFIGCLGWMPEKYNELRKDQLLLKRPSELENDRYLIYVCPECGDIGCGAITVQIQKSSQGVVWSKFGYQNNYDEEMRYFDYFAQLGPFIFEKHQYCFTFRTSPKSMF